MIIEIIVVIYAVCVVVLIVGLIELPYVVRKISKGGKSQGTVEHKKCSCKC